MIIVKSTEFQNNVGKYLKMAENGEEIIISKNGKEVVRIIGKNQARAESISSSLIGILKGENIDDKKARLEKYEGLDWYKYTFGCFWRKRRLLSNIF